MPEQFRTRDCIILFKGDTLPVTVTPAMAAGGWQGGQGVQWLPATKDDFLVGISDGLTAGFMLWGSDESSDQFTAMTRQQPHYQYGQMAFGGHLMMTRSFERYTWASRQLGPLVPIVYTTGEDVLFSLRGLFTNEDEWTLSGDPRAPNIYTAARVVQVPTVENGGYITLETNL